MTKDQLRSVYVERRKALSEAEYAQLNFQLYQQFFSIIDLSFIKILHTFLPIASKKEVDTWLIIDRIRREFPHIRLAIPRVNPESGELDSIFFEGLHQLETNGWGIQEPKQGVPCVPEKIDIVLIPLLAFDTHGHRVGFGKGYYDKFLPKCRLDCKKIGLSFFEGVEKIDDVNVFDVPLTACITPHGVIQF